MIRLLIVLSQKHTHMQLGFLNFLKTYFRLIKKNRLTYTINIFGLAIGVAASLLLLLYTNYEMSYDRFHKDGDRTYRILSHVNNGKEMLHVGLSVYSMAQYALDVNPNVQSKCCFTPLEGDTKFQFEDKKIYGKMIAVDTNFFNFFTFPLVEGKPSSVLSADDNVIISESLRDRLFGERDPLGEVLELDGDKLTISGVMKDFPKNSQIVADVVFPLRHYFGDNAVHDGISFLTFIKLKPEANSKLVLPELNTQLNTHIDEKMNQTMNLGVSLTLQSLHDIHLKSDNLSYNFLNKDKGSLKYIYVFLILSGFILLIAIINFVNLSTAYADRRSKEISMRKVLGSQSGNIRLQYLLETMMTCLFSFIIAIALVMILLPYFGGLMDRHLSFSFMDLLKYSPVFFIGIILIGLIAGFYPAIIISKFSILRGLKGNVQKPCSKYYLQHALVVVQFSIASFLIVCLTVIFLQLNFVRSKDLGFDKDRTVVFDHLTNKMRKDYRSILADIKGLSCVKLATASSAYPGKLVNVQRILTEEGNEESAVLFYENNICEDYFKTYGIQLLEGREYDLSDNSDNASTKVLVNQVLASNFEDPNNIIGRKLPYNGTELEVIGLIKDYNFESLHTPIAPMIMFYTRRPTSITVSLNKGDHNEAINQVFARLNEFDSDYLPTSLDMNKQIASFYKEENKRNTLVFSAAILGMTISVLGLLALTVFIMQRKRKEVGVRKVLGASVKSLIYQLTFLLLKWVVLANIIALPLAYFVMDEWLNSFAYKIDLSAGIFIFSLFATMGIAITTVIGQVYHTAKDNPINAIRTE